VLIFSGGAVKQGLVHAGQKLEKGGVVGRREERSEGAGYRALAKARDYFGYEVCGETERVLVEEYSTDSFQNVLFGLIGYFKQVVMQLQEGCKGKGEDAGENVGWDVGLPKKLIVVSHEFKRARFMDLHIPALGFPLERVEFIGIDPPWTGERRDEMVKGEMERGYRAWKDDDWGIGEFLSAKRKERGWDEEVFVNEVLGKGWEGEIGKDWRKIFVDVVRGSKGRGATLPWE
jgi:hypothetical protein